MAKKTISLAPYFIILASLLWALDGVLRRGLYSLPPTTIVFWEHLLGSLIIFPFAHPLIKSTKISRQSWGALIWVATLSSVIGTLLFTSALQAVNFIPFSVVLLLQKLQPIFAITAAAIVLKERPAPGFFLWAPIALIAAFFVTFPAGRVNLSGSPQTAIAALMALGAAFAWGSSTAFSKLGLTKLPHTLMTALRFFIATPIALAAAFILNQSSAVTILTPLNVLTLITIAFSTGLVALWIYYRGLSGTPAHKSALLELAFPAAAVFIDVFVYHTALEISQYLAAIVLLFSIFRLTRN